MYDAAQFFIENCHDGKKAHVANDYFKNHELINIEVKEECVLEAAKLGCDINLDMSDFEIAYHNIHHSEDKEWFEKTFSRFSSVTLHITKKWFSLDGANGTGIYFFYANALFEE